MASATMSVGNNGQRRIARTASPTTAAVPAKMLKNTKSRPRKRSSPMPILL